MTSIQIGGIHRKQEPEAPTNMVIGVDLGQLHDRTAISIVTYSDDYPPRYKCIHLGIWNPGTEYADVASYVQRLRWKFDSAQLAVDVSVAGWRVGESFADKMPGGVTYYEIVQGTATARTDKLARVPKRELVAMMRALLSEERFAVAPLPYADVLMDEMTNHFRVEKVGGEDDLAIDWRRRPHDDLVLATALACWHVDQNMIPWLLA